MALKVLGVFSYPWPETYGKAPLQRRTLRELYRKAVWNKANPRNEEYMKRLFYARWPDGDYVNADKDPQWHGRLLFGDRVILLYPDAIGLGFRRIECRVFRMKPPAVSVQVLNGRRREFELDASTCRSLSLRRLLEYGMVGEFLSVPFFMMATPILAVADWMKGRR